MRKEENLGYGLIASRMKINRNTIRNWTQDIKVDKIVAWKKAMKESRKPLSELTTTPAIRKRLLEIRGHVCEECKLAKWNNKEITLEIHHVDGDKRNNAPSNLLVLCPNCHSQTDNYRNRKRMPA